jgi:hypothetical protein
MKIIKRFGAQHLAALSLALVGAFGLVGMTASAAPIASAASHCTTVNCVQLFGDKAINDRLGALDKLKVNVQTAENNKGITSSQGDGIISDANTNESGLKSLKSKLDAETTIKGAQADVKNIYVQFRIYAVVLPRDNGEILLFHEQNVTARMTDAEPTIADLIQKDKTAGHDVTKLLALQSDYTSKLADASKNETAAQGLIPSLVPANYPGTDGTLKTYRADLKTAHQDIKDAASDLHQMYTILKADLGTTASGS